MKLKSKEFDTYEEMGKWIKKKNISVITKGYNGKYCLVYSGKKYKKCCGR